MASVIPTLQALIDALPRCHPSQVAALVAQYPHIGIASSRLMKKAAAEYLRRPLNSPAPEVLLGLLEGLAGFGDVKALPGQLITR
jgi:hypothetical protein